MLSRRDLFVGSAMATGAVAIASHSFAQGSATPADLSSVKAFVRFKHDGRPKVGHLDGDRIVPWSSETLADALLGKGHASGAAVPVQSVELLPNLDPAAKVLCMALNYVNHAVEAKQAVPEMPLLFFKSREAMISSTAAIEVPSIVQKLDYEGELAIVIGKTGFNIKQADAWDHVAGVAAFNDTSARDLLDIKAGQKTFLDWLSCKSLYKSTPVGPIVPISQVLEDLKAKRTRVTTEVNGEQRQNAPISDMVFDIPQIIAFISSRVPLTEGDVIATGTPPGVGLSSGRFLKKNDIIEVKISGLPILKSVIG